MQNYYVDPTAGGGGNGSFVTPWNSIAQVNSHTFSTSDRVYFKVGTTMPLASDQRLNIRWDGTSANPAIIGAYYGNGQFGLGGNPRPIIDGLVGGTRTGGVLHAGAIHFQKTSAVGYVHVKDLHITGVIGLGVMFFGTHSIAGNGNSIEYCRVENVQTSNIGGQGIGLWYTFHSIVENCITENTNQCRDHYRAGAGIEFGPSQQEGRSNYNIIRGNTVSRAFEGIGAYKGALYSTIENNTVYDCQTYYIYAANSRRAVIRNNVVYATPDSRGGANSGSGIVGDSEGDHPNILLRVTGDLEIYGNYVGGLGVGISLLNNSHMHGTEQKNNSIYNNRVVDCNRNFRFNHDQYGGWSNNFIFDNYSFIFGSFTHVENTSPQGVTWTNNFFNSVVGGNAGASAIYTGYSLQKTTGWRTLTPGAVTSDDFLFVGETSGDPDPPDPDPDPDPPDDPDPPPPEGDTYTYNPSVKTTGVNPIGVDFTENLVSASSTPTSSLISEIETPIGAKAWRIVDGAKGNRVYRLDSVPVNSADMHKIILWRMSAASTVYGHCIPYGRLLMSDGTYGYTAGLTQDNTMRVRRWANGKATSIAESPHIIPVQNSWIFSETKIDGSDIKGRSWVYGDPVPSWQLQATDATYPGGSAGFQLWIDGADGDVTIDLAWYSVGTEGESALMPAEVPEPSSMTYSVSTNQNDLKTGWPKIACTDGIATLTVGQTGNIGVGARITYGTDSVVYISQVRSATSFNVVNAIGNIPANFSSQDVVSINHPFSSLSSALQGAKGASYLNTADLVGSTAWLSFAVYDGLEDTEPAEVDYVTNSEFFVTVFAPGGGQESFQDNRGTYILGVENEDCIKIDTAKLVIRDIVLRQHGTGLSNSHANILSGGTFIFARVVFTGGDNLSGFQDAIKYSAAENATINIESCELKRLGQSGVSIGSTGSVTVNINMNSCTGFDIGNYVGGAPGIDDTESASGLLDTLELAQAGIGMTVPAIAGDLVLTSYHWVSSAANEDSVSVGETIELVDTVNSQPSRGVLTSKRGSDTHLYLKDNACGYIAGVGVSVSGNAVLSNKTAENTIGATTTSRTFNHNNDGDVLLVFVGHRADAETANVSVTYGGVSMALAESSIVNEQVSKHLFVLEEDYEPSMAAPAQGDNNVIVTLDAARRFSVFACSVKTSEKKSGVVAIDNSDVNTTVNVNVFNSVALDCDPCFAQYDDVGTTTWTIHSSIGSDGSILTVDPTAVDCQVNKTFSETAGDVLLAKVSHPYNLRLRGPADDNLAIQLHDNETGAGLILPERDIKGLIRRHPTPTVPDGEPEPDPYFYDCGAHAYLIGSDDGEFDELLPPENVTVVINSATQATVTWSPVEGADAYEVKVQTRAGRL